MECCRFSSADQTGTDPSVVDLERRRSSGIARSSRTYRPSASLLDFHGVPIAGAAVEQVDDARQSSSTFVMTRTQSQSTRRFHRAER